LRKLGKYMERKVRKTEKISSILTINIKIELIFFLRKNYCPTLLVVKKYLYFKLKKEKRNNRFSSLLPSLFDSFHFCYTS
ncbi:hypothetical protein ACVTYA_14465, partial [Enterococcus hirae]